MSGKTYFCPHCSREVGKTAFFRHKREYYDSKNKRWVSLKSQQRIRKEQTPDTTCFDSSASNSVVLQSLGPAEETVDSSTSSLIDVDSSDSEESDSTSEDEESSEAGTIVIDSDHELSDTESSARATSNSESTISLPNQKEQQLVTLYVYFLLFFQTVYRVSDKSIVVILSFIKTFLQVLSKVLLLPSLEAFTQLLPTSMFNFRKRIPNHNYAVTYFACCPSCSTIYDLKHSVSMKKCTYVQYPNHPQSQHRKACEAVLMRNARSSNGKEKLYPSLVYCYQSIIHSLQEMLKRPGFVDECEAWRKAQKFEDTSVYNDIFDGKVWQEFQTINGRGFLSLPYNFALMLNVDWFQPFKHTQHSEGVIYLAILNLPRQKRFLQKNVILVGVIPGPKEPKKHINSYLGPMVEELLQLWDGVTLQHEQSRVLVRAALLCCACDIPAARKCCGFVGCHGLHGCSRCLVKFPTSAFGEAPDYSNLNTAQWVERTKEQCVEIGRKHMQANTKSVQKEIEREYGIRYTVLSELPYFHSARMCIVDPMHNLLLGTAKHMLDVWKTSGILTPGDFEKIQQKINCFMTPSDIGRLPKNIASSFSGFTAEQYKNWTLYYSLVCLKDVLPFQHYNCWKLFVKACYALCKRSIRLAQVHEGNSLLMEFLNLFVQLYGRTKFTPNMHLHGHLTDCIHDYGPVYSFWLFAFERLNGVLGSYNTNHRHVSVQLMKRFSDQFFLQPSSWPHDFAQEFIPLISHSDIEYSLGSLAQCTVEEELTNEVQFLPPILEKGFTLEEIKSLSWLTEDDESILILHQQTKSVRTQNGKLLGSAHTRYAKSSIVFVEDSTGAIRLAEIKYFAKFFIENSNREGITACVHYFEPHSHKVWFGNPVEVWTTYHADTDSFFLPICSIKSRVIYADVEVNFGRFLGEQLVRVVIPIA